MTTVLILGARGMPRPTHGLLERFLPQRCESVKGSTKATFTSRGLMVDETSFRDAR